MERFPYRANKKTARILVISFPGTTAKYLIVLVEPQGSVLGMRSVTDSNQYLVILATNQAVGVSTLCRARQKKRAPSGPFLS